MPSVLGFPSERAEKGRVHVKHVTSQLLSALSLAHHPVEAGDPGDANVCPWLEVRDKWHTTMDGVFW